MMPRKTRKTSSRRSKIFLGKAWPALDIHVPSCDPHLTELVLAELDDFQPTAIQEPDDAARLRAFFTSHESRDAAARALAASFGSHVYVESIAVEDEDWAARSQAQLTAITIGRITVAPPWDSQRLHDENRGRVQFSGNQTENCTRPLFVIIQPSMGFGTGHHATTRLTLMALQELTLENRTVLDIGCGSGVLAIAAVKLGARSAAGIDIDPDALDNARDNAGLNEMGERVRFVEGDFRPSTDSGRPELAERELPLRADVVLANLTGGLLARSAATLSELVAPGGFLIVSGFMESEKDAVVPALEQFLRLQTIAQEEEWMCAVYRKGSGEAASGRARL
jgi:ribosomal protein L11 methyltransferase